MQRALAASLGGSTEWGLGSNSYLDKAFGTIATIAKVSTLSELNALFRPVLCELGFSLFVAVRLANPNGRIHLRGLFGEGYEAWLTHYLDMGYAATDLILAECFRTSEPFCWKNIVQRDGVPEASLRILREAVEFGIRDGVASPVRKSDGSILVVLFAGPCFDSQNQDAVAAAHLLASYYGTAGGHLHSAATASSHKAGGLTVRQIECLRWVRSGKTSAEIARILHISPRVVDEHIFNACKFLGVRTRAQVVHAASSLGYLDR